MRFLALFRRRARTDSSGPWMRAGLILSAGLASVVQCAAWGHVQERGVPGGLPPGSVRGLASVTALLLDRILDARAPNAWRFRVESLLDPRLQGLVGSMGTVDTSGPTALFQGAEANPMGMLLWHEVADSLGAALGEACTLDNPASATVRDIPLNPRFGAVLAEACRVSPADPGAAGAYAQLWRAFVGVGEIKEERLWVEFFKAGLDPAMPAAQRMRRQVWTLVLHPAFLLAK